MILRAITIEQLVTLQAVAESGSFSVAAARLGVSQPAVSQRIKRLEQALGAHIFDRDASHPRPHLTPAGRAALAFADRVVAEFTTLHLESAPAAPT